MQITTILAFIILTLCCVCARAEVSRDVIIYVNGKDQAQAMEKAVTPYVAKARATYPAAKKRFMAGLLPKHYFSVWTVFSETDPHTGRRSDECLFVVVDSIKDGEINGLINNKNIGLKLYHYGDHVRIAESSVLNWSIYRPDGPEEGNYVGKFLKHWKPQKG